MQLHFGEPKRKAETDENERRTTAEQAKWGKTPESVGGAKFFTGYVVDGYCRLEGGGMVFSACPALDAVVSPAEKREEETPKTMLTPGRVGRIPRQDSRMHMEKDERLGDISDQVRKEDDGRLKKPDTKPGILLNAQFEYAAKQFRKMTTSFKTDDRQRTTEAVYVEDTDGEEKESHGEELRKRQ